MTTSLITQESSVLLKEIENYLKNTIVDLEITDEVQKVNATALGNELQKKSSIIEKARVKEKSVWDAKAKEVQEEFKPILQAIKDKKTVLSNAIDKYNAFLEDKRQKRQKLFDDNAAAERTKLEAFAGKREERLKMYEDKLNDAQLKLASITNDPMQYNTVFNHIRYLQQKVQEFTEKVTETVQAAAQVVAPVYVPEPQAVNKGARVTMEATFRPVDLPLFMKWCVENKEEQFWMLDESKIKARIKEKEGRINLPGLICSYIPKTGFSGR